MALSVRNRNTFFSPPTSTNRGELPYAHNQILTALQNHPDLDTYRYSLAPAGSQSRGTNIRGSSDTDMLVRLQTPAGLPTAQRRDTWQHFNDSVRTALVGAFGAHAVRQATKCIDVAHPDLPSSIDIVPCLDKRVRIGTHALSAIELWTSEQHPQNIISLPESHLQHIQHKDAATNGAFRALVQSLKSHKSAAVEEGIIGAKTAPSYMIESAVASMPIAHFTDNPWENVTTFAEFMAEQATQDGKGLRHGDGLRPLAGNGSTQWHPRDIRRYTAELRAALAA